LHETIGLEITVAHHTVLAIAKNTNGRIKADVFPASQLGSIPRQIEGTQTGAIQGWFGPPEFLVGVDHRFEVFSAPGLFKDEKQAFKVFDDAPFEKMFLSMAENKGLTGIALFYVGPQLPQPCPTPVSSPGVA
jgi:TRAP-type transport system periplasmic protein